MGEIVELPEVGGLHHRYERRATGVNQSLLLSPDWYLYARSGPTIMIVGSTAFMATTSALADVQ